MRFEMTAGDRLSCRPAADMLLAHQMRRIFERQLASHFYPADTDRGQAYVHRDDVVSVLRPVEELGAVLTFLRPGGHVLVETEGATDALRQELEAAHCTILPSTRHPALDRLSRTSRVIARRQSQSSAP